MPATDRTVHAERSTRPMCPDSTATTLTTVVARGTICALRERQERVHDLHAALFGIEASAEGLNRHRDRLTPRQFDDLATALVAEVRRLRSLLDGDRTTPVRFDLADAIDPVVTSARACGSDVRVSVPRGIEIVGRRDTTAQVVLGLLANARSHAPGSPVWVRASVSGDAATLRVEDRGTGIPAPWLERIFERGACGEASTGSGLGLFIARRLMTEQGGSIDARLRRGGGTSFVLRFRRAG